MPEGDAGRSSGTGRVHVDQIEEDEGLEHLAKPPGLISRVIGPWRRPFVRWTILRGFPGPGWFPWSNLVRWPGSCRSSFGGPSEGNGDP